MCKESAQYRFQHGIGGTAYTFRLAGIAATVMSAQEKEVGTMASMSNDDYDIVERLRNEKVHCDECWLYPCMKRAGIDFVDTTPADCDCDCHDLAREAADEIERLQEHLAAEWTASHEAMWHDTLIPIAEALGVSIVDEHGENRRHFQMVEAIIEEARRD